MSNNVIRTTDKQPGTMRKVMSTAYGSPALGTSTAVHAAVADTGSTQTITAAITSPDVPRNVVATPGGTTANVTAVSCVVTGTDANGVVITETLPAFSAGAATAAAGVKAFATVTSISQPACGASVTIAYGLGAKLGRSGVHSRNTVLAAFLNGVREATAPTVAFDAANVSGNTVTLNSALNGTPVIVDHYDS